MSGYKIVKLRQMGAQDFHSEDSLRDIRRMIIERKIINKYEANKGQREKSIL